MLKIDDKFFAVFDHPDSKSHSSMFLYLNTDEGDNDKPLSKLFPTKSLAPPKELEGKTLYTPKKEYKYNDLFGTKNENVKPKKNKWSLILTNDRIIKIAALLTLLVIGMTLLYKKLFTSSKKKDLEPIEEVEL